VRIFASWAIVFLGKITEIAQFVGVTCFQGEKAIFLKKGWATFWA
jgi:hypothetical protein